MSDSHLRSRLRRGKLRQNRAGNPGTTLLTTLSGLVGVAGSLIALAVTVGTLKLVSVWVLATITTAALLCMTLWLLWRRFRRAALQPLLASVLLVPVLAGAAVLTFRISMTQIRCAEAKQLVETARDHAASGELDRAIGEFTTVIDRCPSGRSYLYRGQAYDKTGKDLVALRDLDQAVRMLSRPTEQRQLSNAFLLRGKIHNARKDCDQAAVNFKWALQVDPLYDPAFHNLALTRAAQGAFRGSQTGSALGAIDQAIALNNQYSGFFLVRGRIHAALGDFDRAAADLSKAVEIATPDEKAEKSDAQAVLRSVRDKKIPRDLFEPCA